MVTLKHIFSRAFNAPLAQCDCEGGEVFILFQDAFAPLLNKGYAVGTISAREQLSDGRWSYTLSVDESEFLTLPSGECGLTRSVCCIGCTGEVVQLMLGKALSEFSRELVSPGIDLTATTLHMGFMPRQMQIDLGCRVSIITPNTGGTLLLQLFADGVEMLTTDATIPCANGSTVIPASAFKVAYRTIAAGTKITCRLSTFTDVDGGDEPQGLDVALLGRFIA